MEKLEYKTVYFGTVDGNGAKELIAKGIMPVVIYEKNRDSFPQLKDHVTLWEPYWNIQDNDSASVFEPDEDNKVESIIVNDELFPVVSIIYSPNNAIYTLEDGRDFNVNEEAMRYLSELEIYRDGDVKSR